MIKVLSFTEEYPAFIENKPDKNIFYIQNVGLDEIYKFVII